MAAGGLAYPVLYFILPRYLFRGKYIKAALWILALLILAISVSAVFMIYIPWYRKGDWSLSQSKMFYGISPLRKFGIACMAGVIGSLTWSALAVCFKMSKHCYLKN